ncbi:NAD(P)H-dependent oxidoreductase [Azoarcus sp. TTM-91]|uniref:NAD(P)H-dependent oxidoreductase n=1 Tax=Azoarcus sp. TTM-91 TaxID=2691581 RepID=UPI00145F3BA9|nr:NAD(P)H-dependent oxidoreductase [Azoarcus sp. TTM-91]NMG35978.1 NAD(P)H-dependent oxidoreductase [Azoarcus sp. TTM-91]
MSKVLQTLQWRYATKKFDPSRKLPPETLARILESIRLSASSSGLQPYQVLIVNNPELRARIRPHAWDQAQVTDASHLLVFAAWDNYTPERINRMFDLVNEERGFRNEGWENYRNFLLQTYPPRPAELNFQHAARQAYIGLGSALIAAAEEEVDSTPMEGFDPDKVDEILELRARGLRSVLLLPLGYRASEGDWLLGLKKVRRPARDFFVELN